MSKKLTRNDAYILGRKCILATNGCTGYSVSVDGKPIEKCGHNEGMLGWNWNAFQIGYGFLFVNGYRNFPQSSDCVLGNRERRILGNDPSFEHVMDTREHDVWRITDRGGKSFELDIAPADGPVVVG